MTQGAHVILGLTLVPILLAKLWSVIPKLFDWPPLRSPAHALERASLLLLVGGAVFEFATGIVNIQIFYGIFPFSFYTAHLYGGWVFLAAFLVHVVMKFPTMMQGMRSRSLREELRTGLADTRAGAARRARVGCDRTGTAHGVPPRRPRLRRRRRARGVRTVHRADHRRPAAPHRPAVATRAGLWIGT